MASQSKGYLPLLHNPYLNSIFNNPNHAKAPFKQTIEELAENYNDYTIIVPPAHVLHECHDPATSSSSSKSRLRDMCYNDEDFIQSHIIKSSTPYFSGGNVRGNGSNKAQPVCFLTLNGKQLLLKNGMIFTGKGFKKSLKLQTYCATYIRSFCDYFPKGSKFMLIYIEDTLVGSSPPALPKNLATAPTSTYKIRNTINSQEVAKVSPVSEHPNVTFEKLLRSFPLLSKAVSDKFYRLFHHNNSQFRLLHTNTQKELSKIKTEFQNILEEAYKIISDSVKSDNPESEQTYNLINSIINTYKGIDLNRLVHEYVELNLYDKLWSQIIFQFNIIDPNKAQFDAEAEKFLVSEKYTKLSCLSLNQLEIPAAEPWKLNNLQKRLYNAIEEFSKLSDPSITNSTGKTKIVLDTIKVLVGIDVDSFSKTSVDADTLIGLLIMVVVHSKISNVEAHLYYIKNFNSVDYSNNGYFNYIMSNMDAVLYHLSHQADDLMLASQQNFEFWSSIQSKNTEHLTSILESAQAKYGNQLPTNHFLKSKNIKGESCLMFAIKSKSFVVWDMLLNFNPFWFSVEDILFDKNIISEQNLLVVSLEEETPEISSDIVEFLFANASDDEIIAYVNSQDVTGRSAGHYLFHNHELIPHIGPYLNWELRNLNHHTPLFSLCRCYDHLNYGAMLKEAFDCVYQKYGRNIRFDNHKDKFHNSLLHIVSKNLGTTQLLSNKSNLLNINDFNSKKMTPLTTYVKYHRIENLRELLQDPRLEFLVEDNQGYHNIFDYLGILAMNFGSGKQSSRFQEIEKLAFHYFMTNYYPKSFTSSKLGALNARFDSTKKDWIIFFKDTNAFSNYKSIETIRQIIYITRLEFPGSVIPEDEVFWSNFDLRKPSTVFFHKTRMNNLIHSLNILFISIGYQNNVDVQKFHRKFLVQELDESSTFETIKEIHDRRRAGEGEVKLKESQIAEMEFFLQYSAQDLTTYRHAISRFNKLCAFGELKQSDLCVVFDRAMEWVGISPSSKEMCKINEDSSFGNLHDFTVWIELCVNSLLKNISKVLAKCNSWKEIYSKIKAINEDISNYEEAVRTSRPEAEEVTDQSEQPKGELSRRNTFTIDPVPEDLGDAGETFFNLGGLIENKRSRYKKLLMSKADMIKQIMKLNMDIKWDHETLAAQISNFLKFKTDFIRFAIKQYTRFEIRRLGRSLVRLRQSVQDMKTQSST